MDRMVKSLPCCRCCCGFLFREEEEEEQEYNALPQTEKENPLLATIVVN